MIGMFFFFQAEDGIRDLVRSRGLGDVYKRQVTNDSLRRALPFAGGVCGAEIGGTVRIAREIAAPLLGERRVAPPVAVLAAVQQVLNDPAQRPAARHLPRMTPSASASRGSLAAPAPRRTSSPRSTSKCQRAG